MDLPEAMTMKDPPLYPSAKAEPEIGLSSAYSSSSLRSHYDSPLYHGPSDVAVATIELSEMHKIEDANDVLMLATEKSPEGYERTVSSHQPTVAVLVPQGDILPMWEQDKLGGGAIHVSRLEVMFGNDHAIDVT